MMIVGFFFIFINVCVLYLVVREKWLNYRFLIGVNIYLYMRINGFDFFKVWILFVKIWFKMILIGNVKSKEIVGDIFMFRWI